MAVLGFALNDSGITIPGMMSAVFEAAVVFLLARVVFAGRHPDDAPASARAARTELEPRLTGSATDP